VEQTESGTMGIVRNAFIHEQTEYGA
jgi:hypothetical protein